jgi:hypothetical protein
MLLADVVNLKKGSKVRYALTLIMKIRPPEIRQNAATISVGGRAGRYEVGGLRYSRTYVMPRASAKPTSMLPHCLCTMVDVMLVWWCDPIIMPSNIMTRAGIGFKETPCDLGGVQASFEASWTGTSSTVLLTQSRTRVDSKSIPAYFRLAKSIPTKSQKTR